VALGAVQSGNRNGSRRQDNRGTFRVRHFVNAAELGHFSHPPSLSHSVMTISTSTEDDAFQMAEVAIPRNLFADILRLIAELRPPPVTSTA
jgi:hypothetical protein